MRRKARRLRDTFKVDLLESPIELDLSMEEIMADLEPAWSIPQADSEESETESTDAAA